MPVLKRSSPTSDPLKKDLKGRIANVLDDGKPTVYVCGISYNGAHGADVTDPNYLPFTLLGAKNVASGIGEASQTGYVRVAKEQILAWDPDLIFVFFGALTATECGALAEFHNDPAYHGFSAVKNGEVYAVNPHTSMNMNHETSLVNAYYVGKVLYPDQFADIDPAKKADEIYTYVVVAPVYEQLKSHVQALSHQKVEM